MRALTFNSTTSLWRTVVKLDCGRVRCRGEGGGRPVHAPDVALGGGGVVHVEAAVRGPLEAEHSALVVGADGGDGGADEVPPGAVAGVGGEAGGDHVRDAGGCGGKDKG